MNSRPRRAHCRRFFAFALFAVLVSTGANAATAPISPTVFAGPEDTTNNGSFDQFFNIPSTNEVSVETCTGNVNRHAILEFDLNSIPPGSTITAASLQWSTNTINAGLTIQINGYVGNGI